MNPKLQRQWYDDTMDMSFAAHSQRLLAKLKGATMQTFKLTVMKLERLEVVVQAESEAQATLKWANGQLTSSSTVSTDIFDVQKVAA